MFKGFKEFLLRGNVVDLAVAVVIGAAFNTIVDKFVTALIDPIVGMVFNADSLDESLMVELPGGGALAFGTVIGALINFIIIAAVVYFVFVLPMNNLRDKITRPQDDETAPSEQELLAEIRDLLRAQAAGVEATVPADAQAATADAQAGAVGEAGDDPEQPRHGA